MTATPKSAASPINGIDVQTLAEVMGEVGRDPAKAIAEFRVTSAWKGRTRSEATVDSYTLGGERIVRDFTIPVDETFDLMGDNTAANPQELLMAALNGCVIVGYVACAAARGITLESLEIETKGRLDLRGFLGVDDSVAPGYEIIRYTVRIKGDGTPEAFQEIHDIVTRTSPNYFNISHPIRIEADLVVEP